MIICLGRRVVNAMGDLVSIISVGDMLRAVVEFTKNKK